LGRPSEGETVMNRICHECGEWADDVLKYNVWAFNEENAFIIKYCPVCADAIRKKGIHVEEVR
jgi:hypothetical protein